MSKKMVEPFSRTLFTKEIIQSIRKKIILGQLTAESRIVENQLAEEYNVSRGPIRVALQSLEQEGLVEWLPNGGTKVVGFSLKMAEDMMYFRLGLEKDALDLILSNPLTNFHPILNIVDLLQETNERAPVDQTLTQTVTNIDIQFHRSLLIMANNEFMLRAWTAMANVLYTVLSITNTVHASFYDYYVEHKELADLIIQRNPLVREKLDVHIAKTRDVLLKRLSEIRKDF